MRIWLLPLALLIVFEIIADILSKEWSLNTQRSILWFLAIGAFIIANIFWLNALKNGAGLARGAILFTIVTTIIAAIIGLYVYKESVTHMQLLGIFLGFVSLILLVWE